jgi:hypothetical protein
MLAFNLKVSIPGPPRGTGSLVGFSPVKGDLAGKPRFPRNKSALLSEPRGESSGIPHLKIEMWGTRRPWRG